MCEFCTSHGEGKKWYENLRNYTEEVFREVNTRENLKAFLKRFRRSLLRDVETARRWKNRLPRIYDLIAYPLITRHLKKTHFGQVVPLEDIEGILEKSGNIVRLPCICRKVTRGEDARYCLGVGMDLTQVYGEVPDFRDFDLISAEEAVAMVRSLDLEGKTHSVWTFNTPYIGAVCNCDSDCMAYRFQVDMKLGKAMWKGEYVAGVDIDSCVGCGECIHMCQFGAIEIDHKDEKCSIDPTRCYGCGTCRAACPEGAISLSERESLTEGQVVW